MFLLVPQGPVHTTWWIHRWSCGPWTRWSVLRAGLGFLLVSDTTYESSVVLVSDTLSLGRANVLIGSTGACTVYLLVHTVTLHHTVPDARTS